MKAKFNYLLSLILIIFGIHMNSFAADSENIIILELPTGIVEIELLPEIAPNHVARIKELVRQGFYDGLTFHRVIPGFMAQTGDPKGDGTGGSGTKLKAEFSNTPHVRGTVSMARAMDPNSADSQFFIVFEDAPHLNGQYTVFGKVTKGMEHVDQIKKGSSMNNGTVTNPDKIISMKVAADLKQ
jgi:peptidylprolyl isomerase